MRSVSTIAAGLLLATGVARADVTATTTAVSDYDFRGVSLSGTEPALQGSIDYASDFGLYAGAWASCCLATGGPGANNELDLYVGFTGGSTEALNWNAGFVYYMYDPEEVLLDYPEISVGVGYGFVSGKLWYTNDYGGSDLDAWYIEGNLNYGLPSNFSALAHIGYNYGDWWKDVNGDETIDWSIGVGYTFQHFSMVLKWVDTETDVNITSDAFNNEGRLIFTIATTFPWSAE